MHCLAASNYGSAYPCRNTLVGTFQPLPGDQLGMSRTLFLSTGNHCPNCVVGEEVNDIYLNTDPPGRPGGQWVPGDLVCIDQCEVSLVDIEDHMNCPDPTLPCPIIQSGTGTKTGQQCTPPDPDDDPPDDDPPDDDPPDDDPPDDPPDDCVTDDPRPACNPGTGPGSGPGSGPGDGGDDGPGDGGDGGDDDGDGGDGGDDGPGDGGDDDPPCESGSNCGPPPGGGGPGDGGDDGPGDDGGGTEPGPGDDDGDGDDGPGDDGGGTEPGPGDGGDDGPGDGGDDPPCEAGVNCGPPPGGGTGPGNGDCEGEDCGECEGDNCGSAGGECDTAWTCEGDPVLCEIGRQTYELRCARGPDMGDLVANSDGDGIVKGITIGPADIDDHGYLGNTCPAMPQLTIGGYSWEIDGPLWCQFLSIINACMMLLGAIMAGRILMET